MAEPLAQARHAKQRAGFLLDLINAISPEQGKSGVKATFEVERVVRVVHKDAVPGHIERVTALGPQEATGLWRKWQAIDALEHAGRADRQRRKRVR